jgi:hypothetical protein
MAGFSLLKWSVFRCDLFFSNCPSGWFFVIKVVGFSIDKNTKVPNEYKALPILKDDTPLFNIFKEFMPKDRIWPGRYRNELALAQIKTVSDFALLVITLKLKYYRNSTFGKCYQFDNENLFLKTKEFGGYGWRLILDHLRKQGLDWQKFIIK